MAKFKYDFLGEFGPYEIKDILVENYGYTEDSFDGCLLSDYYDMLEQELDKEN